MTIRDRDTVAPTLTQSINSPAATGWYNISTGPAVITYSATDATSGVTTPSSFTFSDGNNLSHAGITVTDVAGNTSAVLSHLRCPLRSAYKFVWVL